MVLSPAIVRKETQLNALQSLIDTSPIPSGVPEDTKRIAIPPRHEIVSSNPVSSNSNPEIEIGDMREDPSKQTKCKKPFEQSLYL